MKKFLPYVVSLCLAVIYNFRTNAQIDCRDTIFWQNFGTSFKTGDYYQEIDTLFNRRYTYIGDSLAVVLLNDKGTKSILIENINTNTDKSFFLKSIVLYIKYDINGKLIDLTTQSNPQTNEITNYDFHSNGMLSSILPFKGKHRNGKYISFYDNGIVKSFGNFYNGAEEGLWVEYHSNGAKKSEGCFKLGYDEKEGFYFSDMDGYWYQYDENEKLIKKTLYKKGVIIKEENLN